MEEEKFGIDIGIAHPKAIELIPEDFFWSCVDELFMVLRLIRSYSLKTLR
jgi:hypothetical protein